MGGCVSMTPLRDNAWNPMMQLPGFRLAAEAEARELREQLRRLRGQ